MRVAVASAERMFRDGLVCALETVPGVNVASAEDTVKQCLRNMPITEDSLVILDSKDASDRDMDYLAGAQAFGKFHTILIQDEEPPTSEDHIVAISRMEPMSKLLAIVEEIRGPRYYRGALRPGQKRGRGRPRSITNSLPLSEREYQAAAMVAKGLSNRHIADAMNIREQTVKNLISTIIRKLECDNRDGVISRVLPTLPENANA